MYCCVLCCSCPAAEEAAAIETEAKANKAKAEVSQAQVVKEDTSEERRCTSESANTDEANAEEDASSLQLPLCCTCLPWAYMRRLRRGGGNIYMLGETESLLGATKQ